MNLEALVNISFRLLWFWVINLPGGEIFVGPLQSIYIIYWYMYICLAYVTFIPTEVVLYVTFIESNLIDLQSVSIY